MSDRPEPTKADVERLTSMIVDSYRSGSADAYDVAVGLLAAGVTLPPEPEPPQERYQVAPARIPTGNSSTFHWEVRDGHRVVAKLRDRIDAARSARLLNLDESVEDEGGIVAALDAARSDAAAKAHRLGELTEEFADQLGAERRERIAEAERAEKAEQAFLDAATERDMLQARNDDLEAALPAITAEDVVAALRVVGVLFDDDDEAQAVAEALNARPAEARP